MATLSPFRGVRPPRELAARVFARPYDVLNSDEARAEAGDNEMSLYHITKPEINFEPGCAEDDPRVYVSSKETFAKFQQQGWLKQDEQPCFYLYAQTMNGHTQHGIVGCAAVDDYLNGVIKKHELTRADKEEDRMKHVRATNANIEPVFFAYPDNERLAQLIQRIALGEPEYDITSTIDGFRHRFWLITDAADIKLIADEFAKMPALYIADGHHRSAAAALVGAEKRREHPGYTGQEEFNRFMAVSFPASELTILDYNRVVKDLNGMTSEAFLKALEKNFTVTLKGAELYKPAQPHEFSLYLDGQWWALQAKEGTFDATDPIGVLDVDISSRLILDELLDIRDLRHSQRIDFVGGLRGLGELKRRVDSGEMRAALALYPVQMEQIIRIADAGKIMPPKATWFEPKLGSGLIIHKLD